MRCRFCDTEIAAKALICYRCGRATTDPKTAPPPRPKGIPLPAAVVVTVAAAGAAIGLPEVADGTVLYAGWAGLATLATGALALWWGGRAGRR
jgi:hypothetical protein